MAQNSPHSNYIRKSEIFFLSESKIFQIECKLNFVNSKLDDEIARTDIQVCVERVGERRHLYTAVYGCTGARHPTHHVAGKGGNQWRYGPFHWLIHWLRTICKHPSQNFKISNFEKKKKYICH